ncbi:hypothetical protein BDB00DRAFT_799777 [Zychaea mexicana]|uniref:uncharacterized protein n=1 Tax=Zychaea mexicana TaxID=64656 RepID=UPI0022FE7D4B|nr:uncharacterized protein BDB00DRAFT_799777 [Zychaea mexicana]KAI9498306.1 hypothetical protein BDB00DRAFT_799777 [Zychaea mexicana]
MAAIASQPQQQQQQFVKDNTWPLSPPPIPPPPTSTTTAAIDCGLKRHSSYNDVHPRNLWNNSNASMISISNHKNASITGNVSNGDGAKTDTAGSGGSSSSVGMGLLVANTQLLQNMVQMGHLGCRHCGAGTHSTPRDCPYVPIMSYQDAWLQLLQAGHRCDTALFMEAIDVYSKARPNETLPSIARRLHDAGSALQLVALDNNLLPSTTILVDLQGMMRRKYTAVAMVAPFSPVTPSNYNFSAAPVGSKDEYWNHHQQQHRYYGSGGFQCKNNKPGMPESAEQNMARLAEAGFARDLTEIACCTLCKQSGHWAKDCAARTTKPTTTTTTTTYHPPPPSQDLLSSSFHHHHHHHHQQQQQRPFSRRHQSAGNIFNSVMNTLGPASKDTPPIRERRFNSFVSDNTSIFDTMTTTSAVPPPLSKNTATASTNDGAAAVRSTTTRKQFDFVNGNAPDSGRRLYYNLTEYVLVDGI